MICIADLRKVQSCGLWSGSCGGEGCTEGSWAVGCVDMASSTDGCHEHGGWDPKT